MLAISQLSEAIYGSHAVLRPAGLTNCKPLVYSFRYNESWEALFAFYRQRKNHVRIKSTFFGKRHPAKYELSTGSNSNHISLLPKSEQKRIEVKYYELSPQISKYFIKRNLFQCCAVFQVKRKPICSITKETVAKHLTRVKTAVNYYLVSDICCISKNT